MAPDVLHPREGTLKGHPGRWITALLLAGVVASTPATAHTIEGRIVGVHDGDTITLLDVGSVTLSKPCSRHRERIGCASANRAASWATQNLLFRLLLGLPSSPVELEHLGRMASAQNGLDPEEM